MPQGQKPDSAGKRHSGPKFVSATPGVTPRKPVGQAKKPDRMSRADSMDHAGAKSVKARKKGY